MSQKEQGPANLRGEPEPTAGKLAPVGDPWGESLAMTAAMEAMKSWVESPAMTAAAQIAKSLGENPAMTAAAQIAKSLGENPAMTAAARIMKSLGENPAMTAAARIMKSFGENPAMTAAARIANSLGENPAMAAAAQIANSLGEYPAMTTAAQIVKSLGENPAMTAAAQVLTSWEENSAHRGVAHFMSPGMLKTFEDLQRSPLLHYLASDGAPDLSRLFKTGGEATVSVTDMGNGSAINADSVLEGEIVSLLSSGGEPEALPKAALTYLQEYFRYLVIMMEFLVLLVAVAQAYEYLEGKLTGVREPEDVREVIAALPDGQRELLSSYRVLTRDRVILRSSPDKHSHDLGRLQIGTPVEVVGESGAWIKVDVEVFGEAKEGWVYGGFTSPIPLPRRY